MKLIKLARTILLLLLLFVASGILTRPLAIARAQQPVYLSLFYSETCPHCKKEKEFLATIRAQYPYLNIREFEIGKYGELLSQVSRKIGQNANYVPFTVIGEEAIVGYLNDETTGVQIRQIIERHGEEGCQDIVGQTMSGMGLTEPGQKTDEQSCAPSAKTQNPIIISLPLVGTVNASHFSLPLLTVFLGFLDGFNPCAMWILLFLLTLLINLRDRKKMVVLGGTFIFVSGMVYFVFLAAWLNIFRFLQFIPWIRMVVGIVAIVSGYYYLRSFRRAQTGCKATNPKNRHQIFVRMEKVIRARSYWLALAGIAALAVSVNLLELVCSAGLPAIYTQVLAANQLPAGWYYGYLLGYILIFMLDDLVVFLIAVKTWQTVGISAKYKKWADLAGGIVIALLGILLIFKPEWLMFA